MIFADDKRFLFKIWTRVQIFIVYGPWRRSVFLKNATINTNLGTFQISPIEERNLAFVFFKQNPFFISIDGMFQHINLGFVQYRIFPSATFCKCRP